LFIYERYQDQTRPLTKGLTDKEALVRRVIYSIEQQYMDDLTMEEIVDRIPASRHYLMRTFKELTGMSIFHYLNLHRISQAKISLWFDEENVAEIGYKVGFKHPSHFSRNFKQVVGVSPEEYRRMKVTSV
jgi:AraC-like DNA-binding protein